MDVYPATSALRGPSVPIDSDCDQLHRLFERNENAYPECTAVIHEGINATTIRTAIPYRCDFALIDFDLKHI